MDSYRELIEGYKAFRHKYLHLDLMLTAAGQLRSKVRE